MKQYLKANKRFSALLLLAALAAGALALPQILQAQTATEKVRLMADTLRARDSGNLSLAKEKAEQLIMIAPQDENVQRLLASINRELDINSISNTGSGAPAAVFGQASDAEVSSAMEMEQAEPESTLDAAVEAAMEETETETQAQSIIGTAAADQKARIEAAEAAIDQASQLADMGSYSTANNLLSSAASSLTLNTATAATLSSIEKAQADLVLDEAKARADAGDFEGAEALVEAYRNQGGKASAANSLDREISNPYNLDIAEISPDYVSQGKVIRDLLIRGRAQFLNGDYDGAQATFKQVEARDANNSEAKLFQTRIASILSDIHRQNYYKTREQMLSEVNNNWERPKVFDITGPREEGPTGGQLQDKLEQIMIPTVNFSGMEITRVIETLSELSEVYDPEQVGLNIVPLFNPNETNPKVNIKLRNLNLDRVLQLVTQQVNFAYDVGTDVVTIQPSDSPGGRSNTITEFFPISGPTVLRLTNGVGAGGGSSASIDPFSAPQGGGSSNTSGETEALQNFFQSAGVNFELPGTSLAFDGTQLIVTQTNRNLDRMKAILRNYNEVKQVEIEAKFLEVNQNDLEEFGFDWSARTGGRFLFDASGLPVLDANGEQVASYDRSFNTQGRTLNDTFATNSSTSSINISGIDPPIDPISVSPPSLNTAIDLASGAQRLFTSTGWSAGEVGIDFALRALSRKAGSDLMSAPKVTVLSNNEATITVAQELRYPESYGDIESNAGGGGGGNNNNNGGGGGASISITAATPQDFVTRNVGVELSVTPIVEDNDTISMSLNPRVTEFEGFVEYGGPSVAVVPGARNLNSFGFFTGGSGESTVVTVPAGFYQPVFSTREMSTEVTVFDGATIVLGGMTRDEIKTVSDKVPILGDIPGVGRLFRSEGETRQKRNLLIFVTANLVSPGGSPAVQNYRHVNANSLFQNPTIATPSGNANRNIDAVAE